MSIVALQMGLTCGHVSCRDSSNGKYAIKHFEETGYPGIKAISEDIWK
ncbi:MAG: UBP-type zinc finger domain-containing protein [Candidatus Nitrosopumilus limneticus]|nr:UBP-type zinc finger domain-containing protein [Candidatus Nitrosopumilus limneticus]MDC4215413.1 UBP-type zinc finger domain-containing protein [Candidatus Nitrosopumilus limneticus]MDC4216844.1 UBP-type zinc finger domain-containing protein [Candidatus Nitrosopumilus limneticus]MDC4217839.1 UBP-type zinc finger domain-containing protein [Candidatus Nitrosopumilus limneticus]MDC4219338.1 UBP-type zinc finger domain-containing protein [Candidatus Nitrosopumilus limneticus]